MRYLSLAEVLRLHTLVLESTGGGSGVRDLGVIAAAVAQPRTTFDGAELYPTAIEKACALCFSLIKGHGFVDGNKRVAHAALEVFLVLNGVELDADVDEQERFFISLASGTVGRGDLIEWTKRNSVSTAVGARQPRED